MRPASIFLIIQLSNSRDILLIILVFSHKNVENSSKKLYNPVFDSCWKKKSLSPLYLLGCRDFYRCFEL